MWNNPRNLVKPTAHDWAVGFFYIHMVNPMWWFVWFRMIYIRLFDSLKIIRFVRFIQFARFTRSFGSLADSFVWFIRMRMRNPMCGCVCACISADAITIYIDKQSDPLYFMCPVLPMKRRKMLLTLFNQSFWGVCVVCNEKAVPLHRPPQRETK